MPKRVTVTKESRSGRNLLFHDNYTRQDMTRAQFVRLIERGEYSDYHVRQVEGLKTPAHNPDGNERNNLG